MTNKPALPGLGGPGLGHSFGAVHYVSNPAIPAGVGVATLGAEVIWLGAIQTMPATLPEGAKISVNHVTYTAIVKALKGKTPLAVMS